jgi:ubiquinone/menaquinone biosynthesis C-methylase UbiE
MLEILRCPITNRDLRFAIISEVAELRANIVDRQVVHLDGSPVGDVFDRFLRAVEARIYYPVLGQVFVLLPDFAIIPQADRNKHAAYQMAAPTRAVMRFYDQNGWQRTESGVFHDAAINEDFRAVTRSYIRGCHLRVNNHLPQGGKYILDVASGPIQYDEYLTYSKNFEKRICCDVSLEALKGAAARLGDKGIYIQGDITNLPLKDESVDGFVSMHTVYHVPADKQMLAFRELERVTRNGGAGVVVYTWGDHSWSTKLSAPWRAIRLARARLKTKLHPFVPKVVLRWKRRYRITAPEAVSPFTGAASQYSFHAHPYEWYKRNVRGRGHWHLYTWRSISLIFLKRMVPSNALGGVMLRLIYGCESQWPALFGRIGKYPMFVFKKPDATG